MIALSNISQTCEIQVNHMRGLDQLELWKFYVSELEIQLRKLDELRKKEQDLRELIIDVKLNGPPGTDIRKMEKKLENI